MATGRMKPAGCLVFLGLLLVAIVSPCSARESVEIQATAPNPMVQFATERLSEALQAAGYISGRKGLTISLSVKPGEPQSFAIHRVPRQISITGGDDRGLMYGVLRLAEEVNLGQPLDSLRDEAHTPFVPIRAFKFNLPLPGCLYLTQYNLHHDAWFWNLGYWKQLLAVLAEDRYTAIEFWDAEPWSQMVSVPKYPEATKLTSEEMRQHVHFFRTVFRMAKDRGIDTFLITWNIDVPPSFARAHHIPPTNVDSPLVRDYLRDAIKTVLTTYPDLTGLGTTQGEQMGVIPPDQRADWIADVYFRAVRESGRTDLPFILRYWGGTPKDTERAVAAYGRGPVYLDIKYNGEHGYSSPMYHVENASWLSQVHRYKLLWHVRNDDLYFFRWGNPEFVRELMQNLRRTDTVGYTYGSEAEIPGPDDFDTPAAAAHQRWKYELQKQWFAFALWGRLGYDPSLPDTLWRAYFRLHYGPAGDALYDSTVAAGRIAPLITSFHWNYMGNDWYVEGSIGSGNTASDQPRSNYRRTELYHNILDYIFNNTIDSSYENFPQYVAQTLAHWKAPDAIRSPLDVAQEAESDGRTALLAASIPNPGGRYTDEFRAAQSDDKAYGHLALYYAEKIRAAADLSLFLFGGNSDCKTQAIAYLKQSLQQWKDLVAVANGHYLPRDIGYIGWFSWAMYTPDVERDIEIASSVEPFSSGVQSWQVVANRKGETSYKRISIRTFGPYTAAGFHSWLLLTNSLINWSRVTEMAGNSMRYVWKRNLKAVPGREWVLELPGENANTVTLNGRTVNPLPSTIHVGIIPPVLGYEVYPIRGTGEIEVLSNAGMIPQVAAIAKPSAVQLNFHASDAIAVRAPLVKTSSDTLQVPNGRLPPANPLVILAPVDPEVKKAATASFHVTVLVQGFYSVSCELRAPEVASPVVFFSWDEFHVRDDRMRGKASADWQQVSSRGMPLGSGLHTLTIYVRRPGEQIKSVEIKSVD